MATTDTIAAVATPPGRGGVGIVRISGARATAIAHAMLGHVPPPRVAEFLSFRAADGAVLDQGLALYFPAPHSFTGEDVLELHGHGGPVVLDMLLARIFALGARAARPGEFSERAFLNDKMDLVQAEAIADLIDAASQQAARSALRSLDGEFSRHIHALVERLIQLRMYVEAAIDFPEEEIDFLADARVNNEVAALLKDIAGVFDHAKQGCVLREGITIVIAGQPNAGKSSLLNALAQREAAIVTEIAGTTRDVLREHIHIEGVPLHIIDTAGLRDSADPVEAIGVQRAWSEIQRADRVLLVIDDRQGVSDADLAILARLPAAMPRTLVHNKIDRTGRAATLWHGDQGEHIGVSARQGQGLDVLRHHLLETVGYHAAGEGSFMARRRHLDALQRAVRHVELGGNQLSERQAGELLAEELRLAQQALNEITGEFGSEDLLGRIFSSFCIGK